jgi:hypothetical protein
MLPFQRGRCPLASTLSHHGGSAEGHGGPQESERFIRQPPHGMAEHPVSQTALTFVMPAQAGIQDPRSRFSRFLGFLLAQE